MKVRVRFSVEDGDYRDIGDDLFSYPDETDALSCLKRHFEVEQDMTDVDDWNQILKMLETGEWYGGRWTREGDTFKFDTDVAWYEYDVVGDDWEYDEEDTDDRDDLEELAEAIHDEADGHDMVSWIEELLGLVSDKRYRQLREDFLDD